MDIKHKEAGKWNFYIEENGQRLGEMTYQKIENYLVVDHTEVSDALKGKGAGKQLVTAGVKYARINKLKITPHCSFAKSVLERVPEFHDVLDTRSLDS